MKKIAFIIMLTTGLFGQTDSRFEMSSGSYGLRSSSFANAASYASSSSYMLNQQFGGQHTGRMESATFRLGTAVIEQSEDEGKQPATFRLYQNYPNPFNQNTTFRFDIATQTKVTMSVISILGQNILTLVKETKMPGHYEIKFDGTDSRGTPLPSGVYFLRMSTKQFDKTIKFAILR